jgi:type II secretory pathway component PulF
MRALEIQTIRVAMEGNKLAKTLGILAEDREVEATKSIDAMTAAINPLMMVIVGAVVGVLVLSVYQPIISVSSSLT